jgi:hypothetical protein
MNTMESAVLCMFRIGASIRIGRSSGRGRCSSGVAAERRLQRWQSGRCWIFPKHDRQASALEHGNRLSPAGANARNLVDATECTGDADSVRKRPCDQPDFTSAGGAERTMRAGAEVIVAPVCSIRAASASYRASGQATCAGHWDTVIRDLAAVGDTCRTTSMSV